jgi:hypothetical protein
MEHMERNPALTILRVLRHSGKEAVTDAELRKMSGLSQTEINMAADELAEEGMLEISRTYTLIE